MATTNQQFYPDVNDQDDTWGTDVRKLEETVGTLDTTTICRHPNAAGTTTITVDPLTTRTTQDDQRDNFGWAINKLGADGMASTATRKRRIPAGTWNHAIRVTIPNAGAVTGSLSVTCSVRVYRVSSAGTRTLLFTYNTSNAVSTSASLGTTGTMLASSPSQPEYILEANETIHFGITTTMVQTAGLLGATVNGDATIRIGEDGTTDTNFNLPGAINTLAILDVTGSVTPAGALTKVPQKALAAAVTPAGALTKVPTAHFTGSQTPAGAVTKIPQTHYAGAVTPSGDLRNVPNKFFTGSVTPGPSAMVFTPQKLFTGTLTPGPSSLGFLPSVLYAGSVTPAGAILLTPAKFFTGSITPSGTLRNVPNKYFTGTITPGPSSLIFLVNKLLTGTITPSGALTFEPQVFFSGSITPAGALFNTPSKFFTGSVTPSGALILIPNKLFTGTITPGPSTLGLLYVKNIRRTLPTQVGVLILTPSKFFTGVITPAGALLKTPQKFFTGFFYGSQTVSGTTVVAPTLIIVDGDLAIRLAGKIYTKA